MTARLRIRESQKDLSEDLLSADVGHILRMRIFLVLLEAAAKAFYLDYK